MIIDSWLFDYFLIIIFFQLQIKPNDPLFSYLFDKILNRVWIWWWSLLCHLSATFPISELTKILQTVEVCLCNSMLCCNLIIFWYPSVTKNRFNLRDVHSQTNDPIHCFYEVGTSPFPQLRNSFWLLEYLSTADFLQTPLVFLGTPNCHSLSLWTALYKAVTPADVVWWILRNIHSSSFLELSCFIFG